MSKLSILIPVVRLTRHLPTHVPDEAVDSSAPIAAPAAAVLVVLGDVVSSLLMVVAVVLITTGDVTESFKEFMSGMRVVLVRSSRSVVSLPGAVVLENVTSSEVLRMGKSSGPRM